MDEELTIQFVSEKNVHGKLALLGYSVEAIEAAHRLNYDFVVVAPEDFVPILEKDNITALGWDFNKISEDSYKLHERLSALNVRFTVPLYEETVEWAGMINSRIHNNPRIFNKFLLFRDKAMMKRKAQMSGIRVGVFEEVDNREQAFRYFDRIKQVLNEEGEDLASPIHFKPTQAAGSVGHVAVKKKKDIHELPEKSFPCLAESHLNGQEFSVEAFINNGKVYFMNINQYVHLGYSQFTPASNFLFNQYDNILSEVEKLINAFDFQYGVIHPEYFIDNESNLNFGEVAARVPGGHIFDLINRAYGFDPFAGMILCSDPMSTEEELRNFFPKPKEFKGYAGNVLVYPQRKSVERLEITDDLLDHPYFEKHSMFEPVNPKVAERVGFGDHYGTIFFFGDQSQEMKETLQYFEKEEFYV